MRLSVILIGAVLCGSVMRQEARGQRSLGVGGVEVLPDGRVEIKRGWIPLGSSGRRNSHRKPSWGSVSLRGLLDTIVRMETKTIARVPAAIRRMNGLSTIEYMVLSSDRQDIVLYGRRAHSPMLLDDLVVALRAFQRQRPVSCSIDPTVEGRKRLRQWLARKRRWSAQQQRQLEAALGRQVITFRGVPASSHFASVMLLADFNMKRVAMGGLRVRGVPSYLQLARPHNGTTWPRWWIASRPARIEVTPDQTRWRLMPVRLEVRAATEAVGPVVDEVPDGKPMEAWRDAFNKQLPALQRGTLAFCRLEQLFNQALVSQILHQRGRVTPWVRTLVKRLSELRTCKQPVMRYLPTISARRRVGRHWLVMASGGVEIPVTELSRRSTTVSELKLPIAKAIDRRGGLLGRTGDHSESPTDGRGQLIVLDCSHSMRVTGFDRARRETIRLLKAVPPDNSFRLLVFDSTVRWWDRKPRRATVDNKRRAIDFVQSLNTGFGTAFYDAIAAAFRFGVEQDVHLISDGRPEGGRHTRPAEILALVTARAKVSRTRLHMICTSRDPRSRSLMSRISRITQGHYRTAD